MKKVLFAILFIFGICFMTNTNVVHAAEYEDYRVRYESVEIEEDYSEAKQVTETEIIYSVPKSTIMTRSSYEEINYSKTMSLVGILADGSERPLFNVNLSGIFYYYNDGKVHLYSLRVTTHVYEENSWIDGVTPQITNTDGSSSEGSFSFSFAHENLGIYACRAVVGFTKNSRVVTSRLDIIEHLLP